MKKKYLYALTSLLFVFGLLFTGSLVSHAAAWIDRGDPNNDYLSVYYYYHSKDNQWEDEPYAMEIRSDNRLNYIITAGGKYFETDVMYSKEDMKAMGFSSGFGSLKKSKPSSFNPLKEGELYAGREDERYFLRECGGTSFPAFSGNLPKECTNSVIFEVIKTDNSSAPSGYIPTINLEGEDALTVVTGYNSKNKEYRLKITNDKKRSYTVFDVDTNSLALYEMINGEYEQRSKHKDSVSLDLKNAYAALDGKIYKLQRMSAMSPTTGEEQYTTYSCSLMPTADKFNNIEDQKFFDMDFQSAMTYTGKALCPKISLYDNLNKKNLTEGKDYILSYSNNINRGIGDITVKGTGDYTGTIQAGFFINPKRAVPSVTLSKTSFVYNGKKQKPAVKVRIGSTLISSQKYSLYNPGGIVPGTYKASVRLSGNYEGGKTVNYRIVLSPVKISKAKLGSKNVVLTWGKQAGSKYQIQYGLKSNFSGAKTVMVSQSAASRKISGLKAKKKYYFRMRNVLTKSGRTYYSAWSKAVSVKTK